MTPLAKSLIAFFAIGIVVAGTLMLRPKPAPVVRAQLTPAQVAEVQPPAKVEPPKPSVGSVQTSSAPKPEPVDPDFEDGSGS